MFAVIPGDQLFQQPHAVQLHIIIPCFIHTVKAFQHKLLVNLVLRAPDIRHSCQVQFSEKRLTFSSHILTSALDSNLPQDRNSEQFLQLGSAHSDLATLSWNKFFFLIYSNEQPFEAEKSRKCHVVARQDLVVAEDLLEHTAQNRIWME